MSTETKMLTDEQIDKLVLLRAGHNTNTLARLCRDTEQAVLNSPEVVAMRKDADSFRAMVSKRLTVSVREFGHEIEVFHWDDCLAWPSCDPDADDDIRAEVTRSAIAEAVAAMEKKA